MSPSPAPCRFCRNRSPERFCELAGITPTPQSGVFTVATCKPRQVIFQEGNPSLAVYCIKSGVVKLYKTGSKGEPLIIRLLGPGDLVGYRAVLAQEPYAATAEATGAVALCVIPSARILELLHASPEFCRRLLLKLTRELLLSEDQMMSLAQETVRVRTVRMLVAFLEKSGSGLRTGGSLRVPLQRAEVAQMVGTSPETLSRTLRKLAQDGILRVSRADISIQNPVRLRALVRGRPGPT